ncbi:MAG: signal peptide peptidase SppA [bacterium]|nr:signal peptide peptidase SppA [bacterium]
MEKSKEKVKISFWRVFWPSLIAAMVVSIGGLLFWLIVIGSLIQEEPFEVKQKTVLHMKLDGPIGERTETSIDPGSLTVKNQLGLATILQGLRKAKVDKNIKGIFLEVDGLNCGMGSARELRKAINDFESSGKFVVSYSQGEYISTKALYVSSAANESYGFPTSNVQFLGLGSERMFFKKLFDKLEVEMQVIRGSNNDFKSAVEPFFLEKLSDSARHQAQVYMDGLWGDMLTDIAKDRGLDAAELDSIASRAEVRNVRDAVEKELIGAVKYRDEVLKIIAKKVKVKKSSEIEFMSFTKYAKNRFKEDQKRFEEDEDPNIAVILAEGGISTSGDEMTSKEICKLIRKAREEKSVKAVVFRVNSPGGSALASDEIWREVKLTNSKKPVIVSMGDVAASGGYYVAAPATIIFAEPTTITGSIGVFGVIPYTGDMLENKLGITFDRVTTNEHSSMTTNRRLTEREMKIIQEEVDDIYSQFLERVASGRGLTKEDVNVIARGRVWTGRDAQRVGLVDELGGLEDALNYAIKKAKVKSAKVVYYPMIEENALTTLLEELDNAEPKVRMEKTGMPEELRSWYSEIRRLEDFRGIQMRLPYELRIY